MKCISAMINCFLVGSQDIQPFPNPFLMADYLVSLDSAPWTFHRGARSYATIPVGSYVRITIIWILVAGPPMASKFV